MGVVVIAFWISEHAIDVREHIAVPVAQYSIAVRDENACAFLVRGRSHPMLAAVDLHDHALRVTCEIDNIAINSHLAPEMGPRRRESVAQVPPQFSFRLRRRGAHLLCELPLSRHDRAITDCPNSRLIAC